MLFHNGVVLLLLSQSVKAFTVSNSVAFAPRLLASSGPAACWNSALFSEPEAPSVEETTPTTTTTTTTEESIVDVPQTETTEEPVAAVVEVEEAAAASAVVDVVEVEEAVAAVEEGEAVVTAAVDEEPAAEAESEIKSGYDIYISNMSYEYGKEKVEEMFSPFGVISEVSVPLNKMTGTPRGFAFVTMADQDAGESAVAALNGQEYEGRTIKVVKQLPKEELERIKKERPPLRNRRPNGLKIYVGNLPFDTETEELKTMFTNYGDVTDVFFPLDRDTNRPRGFAFVTMPPEAARAAIDDLDGTEFGGREIVVNESRPRGEAPPPPRRSSSSKKLKLYVGNISFASEEQRLFDVFSEYGVVEDLYAPLDQETGRPRGFAFVTMETDAAAQAMNEVDGMELDGRILKVNEAQAKGGKQQQQQQRSSGGGDGGDGSYNDGDGDSFANYEAGYGDTYSENEGFAEDGDSTGWEY